MNPQILAKIPDQVGYLVLNDVGAIMSSGGDLENNENTAEAVFNLLTTTDKIDGVTNPGEGFNRISVCYKEFCYIISMSNKRIYVVKRKYAQPDKAVTPGSEPYLINLQAPNNNSINA